jgi:L-threonylcarbamoyladenylate synthase
MATSQNIRHAARILDQGGVIAYPTEGVFGLGCIPHEAAAVERILKMKERDPAMGLVVIVTDPAQLAGWIDVPTDTLELHPSADKPITWILPATDEVPWWIRGEHEGIAVRQTAHPVASALCNEASSALVSTSANVSGHPPARNVFVLRRLFGSLVDYVVPGDCGPAAGPSEIRDYQSGTTVRPA